MFHSGCMKNVLLIVLLLCCSVSLFARHGKGGYLVYEYLGPGASPNSSQYKITVLHYVNCRETGFELGSVFIGIFNAGSRQYIRTVEAVRSAQQTIQKQTFDGCINPIPEVCFFLAYYVITVDLLNTNTGYVLAEQECCRADDIANLINSRDAGTTNANTIPGIINNIDFHKNSSPLVVIRRHGGNLPQFVF